MKYIKLIGFLLLFAAVLLFSACGDYRTLSEEEMFIYLWNCYGGEYRLLGQEEKNEPDSPHETVVFSLKCSDGTEFSVKRNIEQGMFGGHYYYTDDYLVCWLHDRPELYSELNDCGLEWEKTSEGLEIRPGSFEEVAPAAKTLCAIINRTGGKVPYSSYSEPDVAFYHDRPYITITGAEKEVSFSADVSVTYDAEETVRECERRYVDNVRDGKIDEDLSEEVLKRYGPEKLTVSLSGIKDHLLRFDGKDDNGDPGIEAEGEENLYYIKDGCYLYSNETKIKPYLSAVYAWAKEGGYNRVISETGSLSFSTGRNTVKIYIPSEGECIVTKNDQKTALRGSIYVSGEGEYLTACLTSHDLEELFGLEIEYDLVNGKATIK